ncbi:MAG: zf-HC2 domain-containing protein [Actinomycetota bacterium]|nr:zf-HC2 domain-containing protein [Actinomycetota bacterium]
MTHERCSELLRSYAGGDLSRDDAESVRAHLEECADCRAEEAAIGALMAAAGEPLTELERARLHRALSQELFPGRANDDVATQGRAPGWKRWIVPAMSSAAAVLAALLVITGGLLGSGDDEASVGLDGGGSQLSTEAAGENQIESTGGGGGSGAGGGAPTKDRALSAASGEAGTAYDSAGPQPRFDADAGELSPEDLSAIGRSSDLFENFSDHYTVDDVEGLREPFLRRLVRSSGDAAGQVSRCAATLPQEEPILPAYGATGRYDGRDALVLGFVTNDAGSRALDRYLMWVWTKGECRTPVHTLFERIDE